MKISNVGFLAGALVVCLALTGCGGTDSSHSAADPVISDLAASTLSLSSDDVEDEREHAAPSYRTNRYNLEAVIYRLRNVAAPLFQHYNLRFGEDWDESRAFRTLISEVSFIVKDGVVTVTNKATGGVIFTGPLNNLASGVFSPENIPGATDGGTVTPPPPPTACTYTYSAWAACQSNGTQTRTVASTTPAGCTGTPVLSQSCVYTPPVIDGAALYAAKCASCHGPLATSSKLGRTAAQITAANMTQGLSAAEVQAVADALAVTTPPPPPACSYTLGAWSACQANGTQTRTVTSFPAGCTGTTPASSQSCTYVPPPVTCSSFTYTAFTPDVCPASGQQTRTVATSSPAGCTGGSPILTQTCTPPPPPPVTCSSFTYTAFTPAVCPVSGQQTRTVATSSPAGCTGGSPVLTQACTYVPPPTACTYTTGAWGACQSNGTQTRTVSASPSGCTGTPPASSQSCTYVPPVTTCSTFTYSAWGTCSASGTQTRTVTSSAPAGCTGGAPVLSQSCTPPPVTCSSFTYSAPSPAVCPSSGQQTRTVVSSAPAGCTGGTPVLTVACTYVPDGAALYAAKCASCHGALASSTKAGRTAAQITAANMTQGLTAVEVQAVAAALATVVPPPPVIDGAALYTQYCSGCHGSGKKGSSVSAIQNAISSNRGGMGSLSFLTTAQIQAISAAP